MKEILYIDRKLSALFEAYENRGAIIKQLVNSVRELEEKVYYFERKVELLRQDDNRQWKEWTMTHMFLDAHLQAIAKKLGVEYKYSGDYENKTFNVKVVGGERNE